MDESTEERFRYLIEHSEDVITVVDETGRVTYASPALERVLGIRADEAVGRLGFEFIHPDDVANAGRVLADLVNRPGTSVHLQQRLLHKDGSWRTMDGTVTNLLHVPSVRGVVSNFRDVTGQQEALEALEATEMRYRLVARASNDAIWDWDLRSNAIAWAEGTHPIFGYRASDLVRARTSFFELIHSDDRERIEESIRSITEKGGSFWSGEYRMQKSDGTFAQVAARGFVLHDEEGRAIRMIGTLADVTKRQAAERFREGVIDLVSHEFRTPVTVLQGYAELMASGNWTPDEKGRMEVKEQIERSSRHLSYLLSSITELARLREGGWRASVQPVPTVAAFADALAAMEARRPGPARKVETDVMAGAEQVLADRRLLVIVLVELLDNAARYSPPTTAITLRARRRDGTLSLEVEDHGPGVPEKVLKDLLKPSMEGDISARLRRAGVGLGLAVADGLTKSQGGRIEIESMPGQGTVARVIMPVSDPEATQDLVAAAGRRAGGPG
jgi:PAS domain S-box-containing protein